LFFYLFYCFVSMSVEAKLKDIAALSNDVRSKKYEEFIKTTLKGKDVASIVKLVEHLVRVEGANQHGRTYVTPEALKFLIAQLGRLDNNEAKFDLETLDPITKQMVDIIKEKAEDFPYAYMKAIDLLATVYQGEGEDNFKKAALVLSSFKFDSYRQLNATAAEKVAWYVNTAEFWLAVDDSGSASQHIKRAFQHINDVKTDPKLVFRFKTCYARVLDSERKFLDASMRYIELAQTGASIASESDLILTLEFAVTCAILAPPNPSRSRVLALLMSDERAPNLRNYNLLEKMFKERIVRNNEVEAFQKMLQQHQNAETSTGRTVLQNSIIEHNMFAASKMYNNITFPELGSLLGIKAHEAEQLASQMIEQGRMKASIDQVDGVVEFEAATDNLHIWDNQIQAVCSQVNDVLENITKKHPQYKDY